MGRGIKNWIVVPKSINKGGAGMTAYAKYLEDANHANHKNKTESITPILNRSLTLAHKMRMRAEERQEKIDRAAKGGRPITSFAHSFVVSLPESIRPDKEQWTRIALDMVRAMAVVLDEDPRELATDMFINAHENKSNPHMNILVGKFDKDGNIRKKVTQKRILSTIKKTANSSVYKVMGVDHSEYVPLRRNLPKMKKSEYELAVAEERAEAAEAKARKLESAVNELTEEVVNAESTLETMTAIIDEYSPAQAAAIAEIMRPRAQSKREEELKAETGYEIERDKGSDYTPK